MVRASVFILAAVVFANNASALIVQPEWKIYYDLRTNKTIDTIDTSNPRQQLHRQTLKLLRIGFGPIPCSCQGLMCGCCAGMNLQMFDFNHRACMNFTYDPMEFAINMDMFMDENNLMSQSVSAKNPPPVCVPVPFPPIVPSVDFCLRFFNIHTPGYNIFMCLDFETRMERAPILVLHFDCMELGQDGISHHKPDELEFEQEPSQTGGQDDEAIEVYDEVVEENNATIAKNTTTQKPIKAMISGDGDKTRGEANVEEVYDEVVEDEEILKTNVETEKSDNLATTQETTTSV